MTFDAILSGFDDNDMPACLDGKALRTRGDFRRDVDALARRLETRAELRWALYAANSYDFAVGLFALWCARKTPIVPSGDDPAARAALDGAVDAALGDLPDALPIRSRDSAPSLARRERTIGERAELTLLTSGSSGAPKAVRKCARQLEAEVASLDALWGARVADAVVLATVSHQHIYGLLFKVLWPLASGRAFYADLVRDPNLLRALTARLPRAAWVGSPAQLKRMPERILATVDRDRVAAVFSSGGPLPTAAAHRVAHALGEPPIEVYGSTETGGVAYRQQRPEYGPDGGPWRALPRVELAVVDGRLRVRSPHLPDAEWHATGDLGEILADGRLQLGKRVDRIVKLEEKRVSLTAIEETLAHCDGVSEVACFVHAGVRDFVYAVVALDSTGYRASYALGRRRFVQRLRDALLAHVDRIGVPRKWRFVDALPANAQGKVTPTELAPLFERGAPTLPVVRGLVASDANEVTLALHLPAQLVYFDGHFPGSPVLPGVVQLSWVDLFARQLFDAKGGWRRMEAVKFSRLLLPETDVALTLQAHDDGDQIRFSYAIDGVVCSSGRLVRHG
jgi:acyl-coenzyme A synthetase/AMP-(fatty) acid ligase/3-hydroxymyristoyl/3-hydroxydecanoyl-(acyl carrier protein) dehydratase